MDAADVIDPIYLPFSTEVLRTHFAPTEDAERNVARFVKQARRYHEFLAAHPDRRGMPLFKLKRPCQIEKDETFWTAASLMTLFHSTEPAVSFAEILRRAFGEAPPFTGMTSWENCLNGKLHLFFEVNLPSPEGYRKWLREHIAEECLVPYVLDAAHTRRGIKKNLEGPTHLDALLLNEENGFAVFFEAKALSDTSYQVSFDAKRNQIARNVDVMLESNADMPEPLDRRDPERTLFVLLTPELFRDWPHTRLYGWLLNEYRANPEALGRDLPHRPDTDWADISRRIGWLTFEDCARVLPGACAWLPAKETQACGLCGKPLRENAGPYPGLVCEGCDQRALNARGQPALHCNSTPEAIERAKEIIKAHREKGDHIDCVDFGDGGDNPVFIDGKKCWRRYRFGGWVTMIDCFDCETLETFCQKQLRLRGD